MKWTLFYLSRFLICTYLIVRTRLNCKHNAQIGFVWQSSLFNVPNKQPCTFISSKVCLFTLIKAKRQTLLEKNVQGRLFGTLEYIFIKVQLDLGAPWISNASLQPPKRIYFFEILYSNFLTERILKFFHFWEIP